MAKVGIVTLMPNFLRSLKPALEEAGHEVRSFEYTGDKLKDGWNLCDLENWADIFFCEFCQYPMDILTNMTEKPIIARLWRCEIYNPKYLDQINWTKVNKLYIATENMRDKFLMIRDKKLKPKNIQPFHGPALDLGKFKKHERKFEAPWKIALVGNVIPRKGAFVASQLMFDLGPDYRLTIAGSIKDKEYAEHIKDYCKAANIGGRVTILGEIPHESMPQLMNDHHVILGVSREETAHYAMGEGMATGCYPLMMYWKDSEKIYPPESIAFSLTDLLVKLKAWGDSSSEKKQELSEHASTYAHENFQAGFESQMILKDIADLV